MTHYRPLVLGWAFEAAVPRMGKPLTRAMKHSR